MKTLQRIVLTWAIVMVTTIITMPNAYAEDQAAVVIVAAGEVYAVDKQANRRDLHRRSRIFVGDTLVTGKDGRVQVRFIDGAVASLRPDTELNIQKYRYGKTKADEGSLMTLLKGGFRTITGAIGKEKYKLITSMATIGIRGTHYEAVINNNQLFVALWDGGVTLSNNAGHVDLGLGADYNFGMVQGADIEPQGQIDPPAVIVNENQPVIAPDLSNKTGDENGLGVAAVDGPVLVPDDSWSGVSTIMPTSGTAIYYANVANVSATGSTSSISSFAYNATVDFAAATVNGNMSLTSTIGGTPHDWTVAFSGGPASGNGVSGTNFHMNVVSGMVDSINPVSGTISGEFAGKNAEKMVGSFNLVDTTDSAVTAEGSFTATK